MEFLAQFIDLFLHLDTHLQAIIEAYGLWTYAILFLIVFCETGLVVTPFLPGDSLLFAAGTFAATGSLNVVVLFFLFWIASIIGDIVNYTIGRVLGGKIFARKENRFFKQEYIERTQKFYEVYGAKTIVIARFLPILRTFAPFVAGIAKMHRGTFMVYNIVGGFLWSGTFTLAGFGFGNVPFIKENFSFAIMGIIALSVLPAVIHVLRERWKQ